MSKRRIKREKNIEEGTVTFTDLDTSRTLVVSLKELPEAIKPVMILHSLNTKIGDSAADPSIDPMEAMQNTWDRLKAGEFNMKSDGSGSGNVTMLTKAMAQNTGRPIEEVLELLKGKSPKDKKRYAEHIQIKPILQAMKAENAVKKRKEAEKAAKDSKEKFVFE